MTLRFYKKCLLAFVSLLGVHAFAQSNQLAAAAGVKVTPSVGNTFSANGVSKIDNTFFVEVNYAHRLAATPYAHIQLEIPFIIAGQGQVQSFALALAQNYKAVFASPALKIQFAPLASLSPWFSLGAGVAHFTPSKIALNTGGDSAVPTNKLAIQAGAGLDLRLPIPHLRLRVEARELYTGRPDLGVEGVNFRNNVFIGGGPVLGF